MKMKKIRITIVEPPVFMPVIRGRLAGGPPAGANRTEIENPKTLGRWFGAPPMVPR